MKKLILLIGILLSLTELSYSSNQESESTSVFRAKIENLSYVNLFNGYNKSGKEWRYGGLVLEENPKNGELQVVDYIFAKDSKNVFYKNETIKGADPKTFKAYYYSYSTDKNNVYYQETLIKGADSKTFKAFNRYYALDKSNGYTSGKQFTVDVNTFNLISGAYAKDSKQLYANGIPFSPESPSTFKVLEDNFGIDEKNIYYLNDIIEGADRATFKGINRIYSIDKNNVYIHSKILKGADPKTFVTGANECSGSDKYSYYLFDMNINKMMFTISQGSFSEFYYISLKENYKTTN